MRKPVVYTIGVVILLLTIIGILPAWQQFTQRRQRAAYEWMVYNNVGNDLASIATYLDAIKTFEGSYPAGVKEGMQGRVSYLLPSKYQIYPDGQPPYSGNHDLVRLNQLVDKYSKPWQYQYLSDGTYYILVGSGPCGKVDNQLLERLFGLQEPKATDIEQMIRQHSYDPTNGTTSLGSIFYLSQNIGGEDPRAWLWNYLRSYEKAP